LIIGLLGMIMDFGFRSLRRSLLAWAD